MSQEGKTLLMRQKEHEIFWISQKVFTLLEKNKTLMFTWCCFFRVWLIDLSNKGYFLYMNLVCMVCWFQCGNLGCRRGNRHALRKAVVPRASLNALSKYWCKIEIMFPYGVVRWMKVMFTCSSSQGENSVSSALRNCRDFRAGIAKCCVCTKCLKGNMK